MKIYNRYILTVTILLLSTTVIFVAMGQDSLIVYYSVYVIEALVVTELYRNLNPSARRGLNLVSAVLFGGFLVALFLFAIMFLV